MCNGNMHDVSCIKSKIDAASAYVHINKLSNWAIYHRILYTYGCKIIIRRNQLKQLVAYSIICTVSTKDELHIVVAETYGRRKRYQTLVICISISYALSRTCSSIEDIELVCHSPTGHLQIFMCD